MQRTEPEQISKVPEEKNERNLLSLRAEVAAERFLNLIAERDDLLLRLNDYKVSKEDIERKVTKKSLFQKQ